MSKKFVHKIPSPKSSRRTAKPHKLIKKSPKRDKIKTIRKSAKPVANLKKPANNFKQNRIESYKPKKDNRDSRTLIKKTITKRTNSRRNSDKLKVVPRQK